MVPGLSWAMNGQRARGDLSVQAAYEEVLNICWDY